MVRTANLARQISESYQGRNSVKIGVGRTRVTTHSTGDTKTGYAAGRRVRIWEISNYLSPPWQTERPASGEFHISSRVRLEFSVDFEIVALAARRRAQR